MHAAIAPGSACLLRRCNANCRPWTRRVCSPTPARTCTGAAVAAMGESALQNLPSRRGAHQVQAHELAAPPHSALRATWELAHRLPLAGACCSARQGRRWWEKRPKHMLPTTAQTVRGPSRWRIRACPACRRATATAQGLTAAALLAEGLLLRCLCAPVCAQSWRARRYAAQLRRWRSRSSGTEQPELRVNVCLAARQHKPSQGQCKADSGLRRPAAAQVVPNDPSNVLVAALLQRRDRDAEARRQQERARGADKGKRPAEPGVERAAKRPGGASAGAGSSRQGPRQPCPAFTEHSAIAPGRRARAAPGRLAPQQPLALLRAICECVCCVPRAGIQCAGQGPTAPAAVHFGACFTTSESG